MGAFIVSVHLRTIHFLLVLDRLACFRRTSFVWALNVIDFPLNSGQAVFTVEPFVVCEMSVGLHKENQKG